MRSSPPEPAKQSPAARRAPPRSTGSGRARREGSGQTDGRRTSRAASPDDEGDFAPADAGLADPETWFDGRPTSEVFASFIKPNDRLTSLERLEIYNKQYWFRLLDCLYDDYPGLRAILGQSRFRRLASPIWTNTRPTPSRSATWATGWKSSCWSIRSGHAPTNNWSWTWLASSGAGRRV